MTKRFPSVVLLLLTASGCARDSYFQPDARVSYPAPMAAGTDSAVVTAGRHYLRGPIGRLFLGAHYRKAWATPVTLPVLDPQKAVPGGLRFGKLGGGFQTTSVTLLADDGLAYALRTIDKDPYKTLPKVLRQGFVLTTVRDATSAGMPYGAMVVPPLAQAAGIPHANPRAFYVRSDESGLDVASERFRGKVVLLEEKMEGKINLPPSLRGASELEESDEMLEERYRSQDHRIDEAAFLRARLLDLWLGDWDRHEGQWSWAAFSQENGRTLWRPVPQDRDQVFFRFNDGLLTWLASRIVPKFRSFKPTYESVEGYTRNAHFIDQRTLSELPRERYVRTAHDLQKRLTDEIIHRAVVKGLPREVYALEGARMEATLRARREGLLHVAERYYGLQAKEVLVAGTDDNERFVIERLSDTATVVSVYRLGGGKAAPDSLLYRRQFNPAETHRVVLHGLRGKDEFTVSGSVSHSPFIDIYGGPEEDTVQDTSHVSGLRKKTRFFDTKRNNVLEGGKETKDHRSHGVASHAFDRDGSGR
ncbi:hypothetical protein [Hymenobacter wooponensis]|uniref:Lipoprotein n=1 Tax=Hymenobacter wooponensis TaxID=1525360 RepID=A0A4Z0MLU3_9BACT|nr:hypothetical protein [Hymenobacter wooponensis]TGD80399.1 hypothetical protein EU557_11195 [Hymenobacter wooponensis]